MRRYLGLLVPLLLAASCGGVTSATDEAYTSDSFGYSIDIPSNFQVIDDTTEDLAGLLVDTDLSESAQLVVAGTLSSPLSGFVLWGFDFDAGDETFIPNLNIVRRPREPGADAATLRETITSDYETGAAAEVLAIDAFDGSTGEGLLVEALFPIAGVDRDSHGFQVIAFTADYSYTITYNYLEPGEAERAAALRSFESFTVDG